MTAVREFQILRRILFEHLDADDFARVNMTALNRATARVTALGWDAHDIASQILGDYGQDGDPAALVIARAKSLDGPPPREVTPTPPPVQQVLATVHAHNAPARNAAEWTARIRAQLAEQRRA